MPPHMSLIEKYHLSRSAFRPYDPESPVVARILAGMIASADPAFAVEHIGSPSVPGCGGKGIIDLMMLYPAGRLADARAALDRLGFQRQPHRDPFPEERPMRVGAITHAGKTYKIHVHVLAADCDEADRLRAFRDRLRADPAFRASYESCKKEIVASGPKESFEYTALKGEFIESHENGR